MCRNHLRADEAARVAPVRGGAVERVPQVQALRVLRLEALEHVAHLIRGRVRMRARVRVRLRTLPLTLTSEHVAHLIRVRDGMRARLRFRLRTLPLPLTLTSEHVAHQDIALCLVSQEERDRGRSVARLLEYRGDDLWAIKVVHGSRGELVSDQGSAKVS